VSKAWQHRASGESAASSRCCARPRWATALRSGSGPACSRIPSTSSTRCSLTAGATRSPRTRRRPSTPSRSSRGSSSRSGRTPPSTRAARSRPARSETGSSASATLSSRGPHDGEKEIVTAAGISFSSSRGPHDGEKEIVAPERYFFFVLSRTS
ncbi:hypothetical protein EMIHUDRAFT_458892, partial [Emiliania huxleyi CCMP1516]